MKYVITMKGYIIIYTLIAGVAIGLYAYVRALMTDQGAWSMVKVAPLTINMLLGYAFWGYYVSKKWKGSKVWKREVIDILGFAVITLLFRFGFDMKSIFG